VSTDRTAREGWEELLSEARARLTEPEGQGGGELGDRVELDEGEHFLGRWRGTGVMNTRAGEQLEVFTLWDQDDRPRFHYRNTNLVEEIAAANPSIGDEIVIVRGNDVAFEKQGERRTMKRFAVRARPSTKPLPAGAQPSGALDADIPF
jgi:hypothetical protein